ncbi:MAG: class I SAM-dependent methyltransferase [Nitrososphaera sp.]|nr:class I SAM-dependent methyltransferase [Nitrososphaera sp.]
MNCEICGSTFEVFYQGPIRSGKNEELYGTVYQCIDCRVQRLRETDCLSEEIYRSTAYRDLLEQSDEERFVLDDPYQKDRMDILAEAIENKTVLDFGAGSGSFCYHAKEYAQRIDAIEINEKYRNLMNTNGICCWSSLSECAYNYDIVTSFLVIEHLLEPFKQHLRLFSKLKSKGSLYIQTPIMDRPARTYFRTQHRWYFDEASLRYFLAKLGSQYETFTLRRSHMSATDVWGVVYK